MLRTVLERLVGVIVPDATADVPLAEEEPLLTVDVPEDEPLLATAVPLTLEPLPRETYAFLTDEPPEAREP